MGFTATAIPEVLLYEPDVHEDQRGYFFESYNESVFEAEGISVRFVQDNQARSTYGVIRGLHYQMGPSAQAKLIRALEGTILDVAVDIRKGSPTFGRHVAAELSAKNRRQLFIPRGFAHGYAVLTPTAEIAYKCDNFYNPQHEGGIAYGDPALNIDWKIPSRERIVSMKDQNLPPLKFARADFAYRAPSR